MTASLPKLLEQLLRWRTEQHLPKQLEKFLSNGGGNFVPLRLSRNCFVNIGVSYVRLCPSLEGCGGRDNWRTFAMGKELLESYQRVQAH